MKWKKFRKGRIKLEVKRSEIRTRGLKYGDYGIVAKEGGRTTERQLEAGRREIRRHTEGKIWLRVNPDIPVSAKPNEMRMGKGKGPVSHKVARVEAGKVIYELQGVSIEEVKRVTEKVDKKLGVGVIYIERWHN
jgi:large subunit ribosomal protein L16